MATSAARQSPASDLAIDVGRLAIFDATLAAASDFEACFAALDAHARACGFDGLICRHASDENGQPVVHERHDVHGAAAALLTEPGFRRAWPVEARALAQSLPLTWTATDWPGDRGAAARIAMQRLEAAGVEGGVALSVRGPLHRVTVVIGLWTAPRSFESGALDLDRWLLVVTRVHARFCDLLSRAAGVPDLSRREREILRLTADGLTAAAAARALGVTEATIKFHLVGVRKKLNVKNTAEAIARMHALKARWG